MYKKYVQDFHWAWVSFCIWKSDSVYLYLSKDKRQKTWEFFSLAGEGH